MRAGRHPLGAPLLAAVLAVAGWSGLLRSDPLTATPTPTPAPAPAACGQAVGCGAYSFNPSDAMTCANDPSILFRRIQWPADGPVDAMGAYIGGALNGSFRGAIYTDAGGQPGYPLVQSGDVAVAAGGASFVPLPLTQLTAGAYWLAVEILPWEYACAPDDGYAGPECMAITDSTYGQMAAYTSYGTILPFINNELMVYAVQCAPTITPTLTPSPTITTTLTATPGFRSAARAGGPVLAPVPAQRGEPVCLGLLKAAQRSDWSVHDLSGRRVAALSFGSGAGLQACWDTSRAPPGIYIIRVAIRYSDGSSGTLVQKVAVLR